MRDLRVPGLAFCALLSLSLPCRAQELVWQVGGSAAGDAFGSALATIADIDGDGVADLLVGAPRSDVFGPNAGSVSLLSGASGALIRRVDGSMNGELYGDAVAPIADVNSDGIADWIAGAPFASNGAAKNGRAELRSGADGALLQSVLGLEQFGLAGSAVAACGDANGDGLADFVVCAPFEDSNGADAGSVYVHSSANGAQIRLHVGDNAGDQLGLTAVSLGDVNGDGIGDYAAGTPHGNSGLGMLRAYSGLNGNVIYTRLGTELDAGFASAACALGDLTGDGRPEVAIGVPESNVGGAQAGRVTIINGATGALIRFLQGQPGERLGTAVADAGDWNGDGTPDVLVGAPGAGAFGASYVYSGVDGAWLATVTGRGAHQEFGDALAGNFDIDGDGHAEFAVGDRLADGPGSDSGLVSAYSDHSLLGIPFCFGDGSGAPCPCGNESGAATGCANSSGSGARLSASGSASVAADDLELHAEDMLPGKAGLAFVGTEALNGGSGLLFGDGLRCAGTSIQRMGVRIPGAAGTATWGPGLGSKASWSSGDTRYFQIWYRDANASPCGSAFNLSNGLQLSMLP